MEQVNPPGGAVGALNSLKIYLVSRAVLLIQDPKVIDKILRHLRAKGSDAPAGPWATGPPRSDRSQAEAA